MRINEPHYFEDVAVGQCWRSPERTISERDVLDFADLTGDFNPLHVDPQFARDTPFGRPIAHGLLGLSLVAGLGSHSPSMFTVALVRLVDWQFLQPVFFGDTVHADTEVVAKNQHGRRHGLIVWQRQLVNSKTGGVVQRGAFETLVKMRHARAAA